MDGKKLVGSGTPRQFAGSVIFGKCRVGNAERRIKLTAKFLRKRDPSVLVGSLRHGKLTV